MERRKELHRVYPGRLVREIAGAFTWLSRAADRRQPMVPRLRRQSQPERTKPEDVVGLLEHGSRGQQFRQRERGATGGSRALPGDEELLLQRHRGILMRPHIALQPKPKGIRLMRSTLLRVVAGVVLAVPTCTEPIVPNYNSPTVNAAGSDPSAIQLLATGILSQLRATVTGEALSTGILGREAFNYTPTEGRNTTHYLQGPGPLDPSGFATGNFTGPYNDARNIFNFLAAVATAPLAQAQKDAATGFGKTIQALELITIVATRDTIGAVVEVKADPAVLAPFVSLDSAFKFISGRLDDGATDLANAGTTPFPFALTAGVVGFNTPANFRLLNLAISARGLAYRGSIVVNRPATGVTCATPCYAAALTALSGSFLNTASALNAGPFHTYSTATGDTPNNNFYSLTSDIMAHPSIQTDALTKPNGTRDNRLLAKVDTASPLHAPSPDANAGVPSTVP